MLAFTQSVRSWLHADASNVIAVHCKGGKGRTGTMICCWLLESGFFESARDALEFFGILSGFLWDSFSILLGFFAIF